MKIVAPPVATLFDPPLTVAERRTEARKAAEEAIRQANDNALESWKRDAYAAIEWCVRRFGTFTTDEVWERLDALKLANGANPVAMGPVILRAEREGLIEKTGEVRSTHIKRRHRRLTVWREKREAA